MWWNEPMLREFPPLLPPNILDVVARAFAVVEVGGLFSRGAQRGRDFETLFYGMCDRRGVCLSERAGARTIAQQRSASGFAHEVDAATRGVDCVTHWELKHLSEPVPKNELLIFNAKGQDFLYGSSPLFARAPMRRFFLTGSNIREECHYYAVLWGIMVIEPGRLPLPLIYEAVARGAAPALSDAERQAVRVELQWACRPLQAILRELSGWTSGSFGPSRCGPSVKRHVAEVMEIQEQIGFDVINDLAEAHPDWVDEIANETWYEVGGW